MEALSRNDLVEKWFSELGFIGRNPNQIQ